MYSVFSSRVSSKTELKKKSLPSIEYPCAFPATVVRLTNNPQTTNSPCQRIGPAKSTKTVFSCKIRTRESEWENITPNSEESDDKKELQSKHNFFAKPTKGIPSYLSQALTVQLNTNLSKLKVVQDQLWKIKNKQMPRRKGGPASGQLVRLRHKRKFQIS